MVILAIAVLILITTHFALQWSPLQKWIGSSEYSSLKIFLLALLFGVYYWAAVLWTGAPNTINIWGYAFSLPSVVIIYSAVALGLISKKSVKWLPYFVLFQLWLPIELRVLPTPHLFNIVAVTTLILFAFKGIYQHEPLYVKWSLNRRDLLQAIGGVIVMAMIVIPTGIYLGALKFRFIAVWDVQPMIEYLLIGYFCIALPEEIVFRACLQGLLQKDWKTPKLALIVTSLIFGSCHLYKNLSGTPLDLNNLWHSPYFPNISYAGLAAISGIVYGSVWMLTGKTTASATTHMLVNFIRKACFGSGRF